jgi:hypothetical protein
VPILTERSPYYIRNKAAKPMPASETRPNWVNRLLHLRKIISPNRDELTAKRYEAQSTSSNVGAGDPRSTYQTKLQSGWTAGLRSDAIFPTARASTLASAPNWPQGTPTGPPLSRSGRDRPHATPEASSPVWMPGQDGYRQTHSRNDRHRSDYTGYRGLDHGPAPFRVPLVRRGGLELMAGVSQHGFYQTSGGLGGNKIISPPVWSDVTRGTRSASGIKGRVQGSGREHLPAVFTPKEVR